jgi:hypothetical protein
MPPETHSRKSRVSLGATGNLKPTCMTKRWPMATQSEKKTKMLLYIKENKTSLSIEKHRGGIVA